jgi:hypothetical protein
LALLHPWSLTFDREIDAKLKRQLGDNIMLKTVKSQLSALALAASVICWSQAGAALITNPNAAYLAATTLIPIVGSDDTDINSISGGGLTISFSHTREIHTVPNGGWATWAAPPNSETATPRVLVSDDYDTALFSLTLTFSRPLRIFGLEAEPDDQQTVNNISATFFNGVNVLGTTTIGVTGNAGSRLFAFDAGNGPGITSMFIGLSPIDDFAIAQLRFAPVPAPEPPSVLLCLIGAAVIALPRRLRRDRS